MNLAAFAAWAPPRSPWSPWVKPVLFAHLPPELGAFTAAAPPIPDPPAWLPPVEERVAVVVDLAGAAALPLGLAAARAGYRPVPLYNCAVETDALLDVAPLLAGVAAGAQALPGIEIADNAPPVFLLDSGRTAPHPRPGVYDNRWAVMPQDFPGATRLAAEGIRGVRVVRDMAAEDLDHVLDRWMKAGVKVDGVGPTGGPPAPVRVAERWWFRAFFAGLFVFAGLRRSSAGGFGGRVPVRSATHG